MLLYRQHTPAPERVLYAFRPSWDLRESARVDLELGSEEDPQFGLDLRRPGPRACSGDVFSIPISTRSPTFSPK